ncbi:hypothetical protein [Buchnera aphidicola]|uniref:hypothetical protein n=1 Tax=Buchnera aphidicola TaxID=9 RepID=UPI00094CC4B6|nr:hypothetical protein [Buchnera aphidicola]
MQKKDLFFQNKIFYITIYESQLSWRMKLDIEKTKKYTKNIIKIFCFPCLYDALSCKNFFINFFKFRILIINNESSYIQNINYWMEKKIKTSNMNITKSAKKFLFTKNHTNILVLTNFLEKIILLYPTQIVTLEMIQKYYNINKVFNYSNWIQAIVNLKKKNLFLFSRR